MGGLATPLRCAQASSLLFPALPSLRSKPALMHSRLASRLARLSLAVNCVSQRENGANEKHRLAPTRFSRPVLDIDDKGAIYIKDVGGAPLAEPTRRISVGVKKSSAAPRYSKAARRFYNETYRAESERLSKVLAAAGGLGIEEGSNWRSFAFEKAWAWQVRSSYRSAGQHSVELAVGVGRSWST